MICYKMKIMDRKSNGMERTSYTLDMIGIVMGRLHSLMVKRMVSINTGLGSIPTHSGFIILYLIKGFFSIAMDIWLYRVSLTGL